ncbi:Uncharacterised protein [Legionella pneumophila]|nr:Uncharacterised protein [Legionella pneumophila]
MSSISKRNTKATPLASTHMVSIAWFGTTRSYTFMLNNGTTSANIFTSREATRTSEYNGQDLITTFQNQFFCSLERVSCALVLGLYCCSTKMTSPLNSSAIWFKSIRESGCLGSRIALLPSSSSIRSTASPFFLINTKGISESVICSNFIVFTSESKEALAAARENISTLNLLLINGKRAISDGGENGF